MTDATAESSRAKYLRETAQAALEAVQWTEESRSDDANPALPWVTHSGELEIGGYRMAVHRLSDGRAVIEQGDLERFLAGFLGMEAQDAP